MGAANPSMEPGPLSPSAWERWSTMMSSAQDASSVGSALADVAVELSHRLACGDDLPALGIEVHVVRLRGRAGGVHDRWDRKAVLVDERQPPSEQRRIIAHEVGHLLLGYVNRAGKVVFPREVQERACDEFADRVTAGVASGRGRSGGCGPARAVDGRLRTEAGSEGSEVITPEPVRLARGR